MYSAMTSPCSSATGQRGRRPRKHKTGIFHLYDLGRPQVDWQQGPASVPDDPDVLLRRVAFECFICGEPLNKITDHAKQDTNEHIFPQWLQRRFDLADLPITLSDGRQIKYSDALIPACRQCNNVYMSGIESRMSNAVVGFDAFNNLPKYAVFLWCAKIYYGRMHLEVQPRDGTTKLPQPPSLPPDFLKDCKWLLQLLQGFRKRVLVSGHPLLPFSVIRVPLQVGKDETFYFQSRSPTKLPGIALQMGRVGLISVFDDFGLTENWYTQHFARALAGKALHPVQFWELAGRAFYATSLQPFHTFCSLLEGEFDMWLEYSPEPEHQEEFDQKAAASWVRLFTNAPKDVPFWNPKTGGTITFLMKSDDSFNDMPLGDDDP